MTDLWAGHCPYGASPLSVNFPGHLALIAFRNCLSRLALYSLLTVPPF